MKWNSSVCKHIWTAELKTSASQLINTINEHKLWKWSFLICDFCCNLKSVLSFYKKSAHEQNHDVVIINMKFFFIWGNRKKYFPLIISPIILYGNTKYIDKTSFYSNLILNTQKKNLPKWNRSPLHPYISFVIYFFLFFFTNFLVFSDMMNELMYDCLHLHTNITIRINNITAKHQRNKRL